LGSSPDNLLQAAAAAAAALVRTTLSLDPENCSTVLPIRSLGKATRKIVSDPHNRAIIRQALPLLTAIKHSLTSSLGVSSNIKALILISKDMADTMAIRMPKIITRLAVTQTPGNVHTRVAIRKPMKATHQARTPATRRAGPMDNRLVATATSEKGMHKERAMAAMSKAMVAISRARAAMDKAMKPTIRVTASRGKGMADIEQALLQFRQIDVCSPV
jgi:hypothetical protein